jgi:hypothetical protein
LQETGNGRCVAVARLETFLPDIERVEALTGFDLAGWKTLDRGATGQGQLPISPDPAG